MRWLPGSGEGGLHSPSSADVAAGLDDDSPAKGPVGAAELADDSPATGLSGVAEFDDDSPAKGPEGAAELDVDSPCDDDSPTRDVSAVSVPAAAQRKELSSSGAAAAATAPGLSTSAMETLDSELVPSTESGVRLGGGAWGGGAEEGGHIWVLRPPVLGVTNMEVYSISCMADHRREGGSFCLLWPPVQGAIRVLKRGTRGGHTHFMHALVN